MRQESLSLQKAPTGLPVKKPRVIIEHEPDGIDRIYQDYPAGEPPESIAHLFLARASEIPDRPFIAQREKLGSHWGDWHTISYREARTKAFALAQYFIDQGAGPDHPILVLSGPSINHAITLLAAMFARAPIAATPVAYSLVATEYSKLEHVYSMTKPQIVIADGGPEYAEALKSLPDDRLTIITAELIEDLPSRQFEAIWQTAPENVQQSIDQISSDTVVRYVFTSGSTGKPKGVIHTHGTLGAQIAARNALLEAPEEERHSIRLSWMPWNHIGALIHLNYVIHDGGTYYIDEGRPIPGEFDETLRNLRDVIPLEFNSVPILFGQLATALERDKDLRERFFSTVRYMSYGSASLSDDIIDRLQSMSLEVTGQRVPFCTKYGTSEVQAVTHSAYPMERAGEIGIPYPGVVIKLVPKGDKREMLVKGDMVAKGYLGGKELNEGIFDDEGFYRTGDAARYLDPQHPERGLMFDGRVGENFKLSSGTWVPVGNLRLQMIEKLSPLIHDCVITGHDRDYIGLLAWLRPEDAAIACDLTPETPMSELVTNPVIIERLRKQLETYNAGVKGSSLRVKRILLLEEPAQGEEVAEKGYINQRATLDMRADKVKKLYAEPPHPEIIAVA